MGLDRNTIEFINSDSMRAIWLDIKITGRDPASDIIKLSVGPHHGLKLTPWEKMLAKLITEDNFGADRIDYLIRDARYTGVGYGHFDSHQLIDSLRIIPDFQNENMLTIGVLESGVQSVESLWIARYLMYERVYHHKKARIYTRHMIRFMQHHFSRHPFPNDLEGYLNLTDYTILVAIQQSAGSGNYDAKALLYEVPSYKFVPLNGAKVPLEGLQETFNEDVFVDNLLLASSKERLFSVIKPDGSVISSLEASHFLRDIPVGGHTLCVYAHPNAAVKVYDWLTIIKT